MSRGWKFQSGDWNFECDSCGQKKKASTAKKRWDGFMVCPSCFETRHPQDFLRARQDNQAVPWARSKQPLSFVHLDVNTYLQDQTNLVESIDTAAGYYRYIGLITYPDDTDVVNGTFVNSLVLNSNDSNPGPPINPEQLTISESVSTVLNLNTFVTDTITLSEVITEGEAEYPGDSFSLVETVSPAIVTNKVINYHTLNEVILG